MERQHILAIIDRAFAQTSRPQTYLRDPTHCADCAAQDALLRTLTRETIRLRHLDAPANDAVCEISDAAFKYFMPGLVRHVLARPESNAPGCFLRLLERRIDTLEHDQFKAVTALVDYLYRTTPTAASSAED